MPSIPVKLSRTNYFILSLLAFLLPAPLIAEQQSLNSPEKITIPLAHLPFDVKGNLRRPIGGGPFPAVILLPACGAFMNSVDQGWGQALASWGYIALTLDIFSPRGIKGGKTCLYPAPPEIAEDVSSVGFADPKKGRRSKSHYSGGFWTRWFGCTLSGGARRDRSTSQASVSRSRRVLSRLRAPQRRHDRIDADHRRGARHKDVGTLSQYGSGKRRRRNFATER